MDLRLTLVSASPRRSELLARIGLPFEVLPSHALEEWLADSPEDLARHNAERKVRASTWFGQSDRVLLGADTIVHCDGRILGKPAGRDSAKRMLELLSGRWHDVLTGFCLAGFDCGGAVRVLHSETVVSRTRFTQLTRADIRDYVKGGEWQGKAGGYAIQGDAGKFVLEFSGDYDNIVGLPTERIRERIATIFSNDRFL